MSKFKNLCTIGIKMGKIYTTSRFMPDGLTIEQMLKFASGSVSVYSFFRMILWHNYFIIYIKKKPAKLLMRLFQG